MYANYAFYIEDYGGELISSLDWPRISCQADAYLDRLTYNRLRRGSAVTDAVRMAACAIAEVIERHRKQQEVNPSGIKSESVGGQSIAYEDAATLIAQYDTALLDAADLWLPRTDPLRYAGVYGC
ncbi:MAG: hypothetical protein ACLU4W_04970 [Acutalibacteraceae bacterium]